ncbi:MFS transporter [Amycolatopsis cihanbeyliensis]|uniref:Putative MFS family arabinose efflux permease n=1 Tax=Amycolatopsis cihanbeyliensis TaxID=1128664 RepID=A0A542DGR4_AMYCI|nr:putative MFS family arabinose efflux permease [Amycolatopsis cihanbeyliensis]
MSFGSVLAEREFRSLWFAELLSVCGDQLARVALAVLVFQRTNSAALTGLTYALTYIPTVLGGVLLASWGDRRSRRDVMVLTDLVRALLVGAMVLPGLPLWVLCVLVAVMTLFGGPFKAAQQAILPTVLKGERYTVGMALRNVTMQSAQVAGFAGGGLLVAAINPTMGLAVNAATFAVSGLVVRYGVRYHPPVAAPAVAAGWRSWLSSTTAGARLVWRDTGLRTLVALNWLAGFYVVPETIAAPYAASLGLGTAAVGWLMAADPIGSVLGGFLFGRWIPERVQVRVIGLLGIAAGVPLVLCLLHPGLVPSMVLFGLSGLLATGYNIQGVVQFMRRLPDAQRAQGSGLNSTGLVTVQGLGAAAAGGLAELIGPAHTIAVAGAAGIVVAVPIAMAWGRVRTRPGVTPAAEGAG